MLRRENPCYTAAAYAAAVLIQLNIKKLQRGNSYERIKIQGLG